MRHRPSKTRKRFLRVFRATGSVSHASRTVGFSRARGSQILREEGLTGDRRAGFAFRYRHQRAGLARAIALIQEGMSMHQAARRADVRYGYLTAYLLEHKMAITRDCEICGSPFPRTSKSPICERCKQYRRPWAVIRWMLKKNPALAAALQRYIARSQPTG
jgi:hypothetical protein